MMARLLSEKKGINTRMLRDVSAPLLRLSPTGWCRVIEKLAMLDHGFYILPAEEAIVRQAAGELNIAPIPNAVSLNDHLKRQALAKIHRRDFGVVSNLIEEIDQETGHFKGDLLELSIILERPATDLEEKLRQINHLRPLGCGAATLHQALRCQISELPAGSAGEVARLLLTDYWDTFSGGGRAILSEISGLGHHAIESGIATIRKHLTPYPSERFWGENGGYLKRAFCYIEETKQGKIINEPYESEFYAAQKLKDTNDIVLVIIEALKERQRVLKGMINAFSRLDFDDPKDRIDISVLSGATNLPLWHTWMFTESEMIIDVSGDRRYLRELISIEDDIAARLFQVIDREIMIGKAETDLSLAKHVSRGTDVLSDKQIIEFRKEYGIANSSVRGDRAILLLMRSGLS